jgi:putative ABC transport system substrate-binding protein
MNRREFIVGVGGTAATWPVAASAQQSARMPVIGMLNGQSADSWSYLVAAFRLGLKEAGFVEGQNVLIEYRWAENHYERLPAMAIELVNRKVDALITGGTIWATISAKAATATIPIVFTTGSDPVRLGYVTSLNRPGGNITGVTFLAAQLLAKRLEISSQLTTKDAVIGFLGRPVEPRCAADKKELEGAAVALKRKLLFFDVADERDLEVTMAEAARQNVGMLIVHNDPFFNNYRKRLISLAGHYAVPTAYESREYVAQGGLISYGASITGTYRQAGVYIARILKGEKAGDLPVEQQSRYELAINLKTAKALGLTVPPTLLARADEVIE